MIIKDYALYMAKMAEQNGLTPQEFAAACEICVEAFVKKIIMERDKNEKKEKEAATAQKN